MLSMISGSLSVELSSLVMNILEGNMLAARQWVADAARTQVRWSMIPRPITLDETQMAVAASLVEMLAERSNQPAPAWTQGVPSARASVFLVKEAAELPRLRKLCEEQGPEQLRRRRIFAPPDFLTAA
jgi:hypothetical protein